VTSVRRRCLTLVLAGLLIAGCASAGGTAGIFDIGSVWYKHPTTGDVSAVGASTPGSRYAVMAAERHSSPSAIRRSRSARPPLSALPV